MSSIDRNWILEQLSNDKRIQDERANAFAHQSNALSAVAISRAYSLELLIKAVENDLMERLNNERVQAELDGMVWP